MKPFDIDITFTNEYRTVFYNAEDVAENGECANIVATPWQEDLEEMHVRKIEQACKFALENGFDCFEIELNKKELRTLRFYTGGNVIDESKRI